MVSSSPTICPKLSVSPLTVSVMSLAVSSGVESFRSFLSIHLSAASSLARSSALVPPSAGSNISTASSRSLVALALLMSSIRFRRSGSLFTKKILGGKRGYRTGSNQSGKPGCGLVGSLAMWHYWPGKYSFFRLINCLRRPRTSSSCTAMSIPTRVARLIAAITLSARSMPSMIWVKFSGDSGCSNVGMPNPYMLMDVSLSSNRNDRLSRCRI